MTILDTKAYEFYRKVPPMFSDRNAQLFWKLQDAAEAYEAFMGEVGQHLEERRAESHDEAIAAGRAQLEVVEELESEIRRWESGLWNLQQAQSQASVTFQATKEAEPSLDRFATRSEIAEWKDSVQAAENAYEVAMERLSSHNATIGGMRMKLQRERVTLQDLRAREVELRGASEKVRPSYDPSTGLGSALPNFSI